MKKYQTPNPPSKKLLTMEIECFTRRIKELEKKKGKLEDIQVCKAEIIMRLDLFRQATGVPYENLIDIPMTEKVSLSRLFEEFHGHSWKRKFGWIGQPKSSTRPAIRVFEAEAALYDGVKVEDYHVTNLEFVSADCEGHLPETITNFHQVKSVDFHMNNINGHLPRSFSRMEALEFLNMGVNRISGEIEWDCFGSNASVRMIDLSFNCLGGSLPNSFELNIKIQELNLAGNQFEGELPSSMSYLVNLRVLKLYSNKFRGRIPSWISTFERLIEVNLSQNQFTSGVNEFFS